MLTRVLEPEVMDTREEAVDYDSMDHRTVNRLFVDHLLQAAFLASVDFPARSIPPSQPTGAPTVLDVGTGTAQIPIELVGRERACRVTAIDLARHMLELAALNVAAAGYSRLIELQLVDAKQLPYPDGAFDVVMSNSIIHHIPNPAESFHEMVRLVRPGGLLFVRDLLRPPDLPTLTHLVAIYAGDANAHQQKMFRESLHAALTLDEVRSLIGPLGVTPLAAVVSSDRHWTVGWKKP